MNPPPVANNRYQTASSTSSANPTAATSIRIPESGSSRGHLLSALSNAIHKVPHAISGTFHGHTGSTSQNIGQYAPSVIQYAPPVRPAKDGEFDLETIRAAPGEVVPEWDQLITEIKATADEVAEDYKEEETVVPGFADGIKLRPWQVQGRRWMLERETGNKRGGILADDVSHFPFDKKFY